MIKTKTYTIPVDGMPAKKKRWWEFWRRKGDSADESLRTIVEYYQASYESVFITSKRKSKITSLWGIHKPEIESDYWFPSK